MYSISFWTGFQQIHEGQQIFQFMNRRLIELVLLAIRGILRVVDWRFGNDSLP